MITKEVLRILINKNLTIAFAESITGGNLVSSLIKEKDASKVCSFSIVLYSNEMKIKYADITLEDINKYGVVSENIARKLSLAAKRLGSSDIGVGITGSAGPTSEPNSNVGEVWFVIYYLNNFYSYKLQYNNKTRKDIIEETTKEVYEKLYNLLNN